MATVERIETPTTVNRVAYSFRGWLGRAAEMAIAAEAPQIAVAPPDRTPKRGSNPIHRAASVDAPIVNATAPTTSRSGLQPSDITSVVVIFRPRSATPRRSTN